MVENFGEKAIALAGWHQPELLVLKYSLIQ